MRKFLKTLLCLFLAAVITFAAVAAVIIRYGTLDEKQQSDAIIVLGASSWNGQVSPVFRERINHGILLYESGYADCIIFTGGYGEGSSVSESGAAKIYALSQGVPEEDIYIEEKSRITEGNMKYAKEIMDENSLETAIIVSDPLHMNPGRISRGLKEIGSREFMSSSAIFMVASGISAKVSAVTVTPFTGWPADM